MGPFELLDVVGPGRLARDRAGAAPRVPRPGPGARAAARAPGRRGLPRPQDGPRLPRVCPALITRATGTVPAGGTAGTGTERPRPPARNRARPKAAPHAVRSDYARVHCPRPKPARKKRRPTLRRAPQAAGPPRSGSRCAVSWLRPRWSCSRPRGTRRPRSTRSPQPAGVARRTFFRHFRSKEEAIFPDHDDTLVRAEAVLNAAPPHENPLDTVCRGIKEVMRMYAASPVVSVARYKLTREVPTLREAEIASVARYERLFTRYLLGHFDEDDQHDGNDDPLLAEVAASAVVTAHNHVLRRWLRAGGQGDCGGAARPRLRHRQGDLRRRHRRRPPHGSSTGRAASRRRRTQRRGLVTVAPYRRAARRGHAYHRGGAQGTVRPPTAGAPAPHRLPVHRAHARPPSRMGVRRSLLIVLVPCSHVQACQLRDVGTQCLASWHAVSYVEGVRAAGVQRPLVRRLSPQGLLARAPGLPASQAPPAPHSGRRTAPTPPNRRHHLQQHRRSLKRPPQTLRRRQHREGHPGRDPVASETARVRRRLRRPAAPRVVPRGDRAQGRGRDVRGPRPPATRTPASRCTSTRCRCRSSARARPWWPSWPARSTTTPCGPRSSSRCPTFGFLERYGKL